MASVETIQSSVYSRFSSKYSSISSQPLAPIKLWRRAESRDISQIIKLVKTPQTTELFGDFDIHGIIERAYISLTEENKDGEVVANISLCDCPNIPALLPSEWLHWIHQLYGLSRATIHNTLFIHLLVWKTEYTHEFLSLLLDSIFLKNSDLEHLILVVPPNVSLPEFLHDFFTKILPLNYTEVNKVQTLYLCMRNLRIKKLRIRRAMEEDNDDIVPIVDRIESSLREMYGDYYIAEMVRYPDEHRRIIVAEEQEKAIGVLILTTDISYDILQEYFELTPFYGLRQFDERDKVAMPEFLRTDSREGLHYPRVVDSTFLLASVPSKQMTVAHGAESSASIQSSIASNSDSNLSDLSISNFLKDPDESEGNVPENAVLTKTVSTTPKANHLLDKLGEYKRGKSIKLPTHFGAENAFAIELFALDEQYDERLSHDFLAPAFEVFPNLDYCIITVPPSNTCFPLLSHFSRVVPRPNKSFPNELYVVHRNSIISEFKVREASSSDDEEIKILLSTIAARKQIQADYLQATRCKEFDAFVMSTEDRIVGLAITGAYWNIDYLKSHYWIEEFVDLDYFKPDEYGILKHYVLSSIFHKQSRYFLKEISRLSDIRVLFYQYYYHSTEMKEVSHRSVITCIEGMLPVSPRRQIEYYLPSLEINVPKEAVLHEDQPFALYMMAPKYTSLVKLEVNMRLVVVGASDTALAFLEALLFGDGSAYLTFTNITLVSPHGLRGDGDQNQTRDYMIPFHGRYSREYLQRINLRKNVNIVYGLMTEINRNMKYILINDDWTLPYDRLMLFCGEQFQKPRKKQVSTTTVTAKKSCSHNQSSVKKHDTDSLPVNAFLINSEIDASNALIVLQTLMKDQNDYQIVVHGQCIHAYCCIEALLKFGIPGPNIVFVESKPIEPHSIVYFNNSELDEAVMESMQSIGIKMCLNFEFTGWEVVKNRLTKVTFESKTKTVSIKCIGMFCYGLKNVGVKTLQALNTAGLVYDGRLVISRDCETNDPHIFAAGPLTKYKRRYYADHLSHVYFNSVEIGTKLGERMKRQLDPTDNTFDLKDQDRNELLTPVYKEPMIVSCYLPGGIHYLHVAKPGMMKPLEAAMNHEEFGQVLITGDYKQHFKGGLFRLHLNNNSVVETITCYAGEQRVEVMNFIRLYGLHERLLNHMLSKYTLGRIDNFYDYFKEPWATALFHDRFDSLLLLCRHTTLHDEAARSQLIIQDLVELLKSRKKKSVDNQALITKFEKLGYHESLEKIVLEYIERNDEHLPMYATLRNIKTLLQSANVDEVMKSPMQCEL